MFFESSFDVLGWCSMNKYHNRAYLMSKLINTYTLFLAIGVRYVSRSLRIFIKLFIHLSGVIEGYSLWINSYTNNYGICTECYITMARSKGGCSATSPFRSSHCYITQNIEHRNRVSKTLPSNKNSFKTRN